MNPLHKNLVTGTAGELLVQIRLLQHGVQAAPPLKDSGNDLIAVRGDKFKALQVKTTSTDRFDLRGLPPRYHIVACVHLCGEGRRLDLDKSDVYLLTHKEVGRKLNVSRTDLQRHEISGQLVTKLF
jgi:hypothetical protein